MKPRLREIAVAILTVTFISLLLLQTRLMSETHRRNEKISVLRRSALNARISSDDDMQDEITESTNYEDVSVQESEARATRDSQLPADEEYVSEEPSRQTDSDTAENDLPASQNATPGLLTAKSVEQTHSSDDYCPNFPGALVGALNVNVSYEPTEQEAMEAAGPVSNGCYKPTWCRPQQSVAIIIPYKNRLRHLITLTHHIHPILQRQAIQYCVIVAEQYDNGAFNKARVMNAAFKEITTKFEQKFDCVMFHDVDMMLEDDRNLYKCTRMPRHLSPAIDKFNYTLKYGTQYGGVTAMSVENYIKVNGHGNNFWGWGGEDNDMENRIAQNDLFINVTNPLYGRYKMIPHDHPWWFSPLFGAGSYLKSKGHWSEKKVDRSGLNTTLYTIRSKIRHKLWTKITLDIRTFLVEKAIVRFKSHDEIGRLEQRSSSFTTEDDQTIVESGALPQGRCEYHLFTNKTINKTIGLMERNRLKYGRMHHTVEKAIEICNEMREFCGAVVEEHPGRFSLRATGYMHENYLRYRQGIMNQHEIIEVHHTRSVRVKSCQSSEYMSFFTKPVVLEGDAKSGRSPAYYIEFHIRLFYHVDKVLHYSSEIVSAHGRIESDLVHAKLKNSTWSSLNFPYNSRLKLLNTTDPKSLEAALGEKVTLDEIIKKRDGLLTVKTPLSGVLRRPGCYVCKSTLTDHDGAVLMQWNWWFEIRAKTEQIEKEILDKQLRKVAKEEEKLSISVEKKRQMWLQHQEKMKNAGKSGPIPDHILERVMKESHVI